MMEVPSREEAILEAVLMLPLAQQAQYLDKVCGKDGPERERIEVLLNSRIAAAPLGAEVVKPAATIMVTLPPSEQPGDRIGQYKLLQQIGEGGCGVVYMAEQEHPVRRRVALKVIKLGMDTKSVIARFEAERQALALMDHPNIAKVLDAGATQMGRPYFVMELVRGVKLTQYCDENKLSTNERLELFIQVCHAIQHAHQKGIIHRDIKPSNILVTLHDGIPIPKVIDFGIAKATDQRLTDKTLFTQFEQFIGTPAYMSPEQAEMSGLDIDTRSDIYSLGVLLYELLTGKTPFDAKALMESGLEGMRRTIREREPERPSTRLSSMLETELTTTASRHRSEAPKLISLIRGDLDWIVMKALEKDRTRRYETANGLAVDVQRYLNNETVMARPPSSAYRLQKLVRRNKTSVAAGLLVAFAMVVGSTACLYLFVQERRARQRAVVAEKEQARLREKAEAAAALEARMRQQAEFGEKYSRAGLLLSKGQFEEAEQIVNEIPPHQSAVPFFNVLTYAHAQRGEWAAALRNCTLLAQFCAPTNSPLHETTPAVYHALAPLLIQNGELQMYRQLCRRIVEEYGSTSDPIIAERLAKDCFILPPPEADLQVLNKMADSALSAGPSHKAWPYFQFVKAFADYRSSKYTNAIVLLQNVVIQKGDARRSVQGYMVLALAQHHAGFLASAVASLEAGLELSKRSLHEPSRSTPDEVWNDWIIAQSLIREATTLIPVPNVPASKR